MKTISLTPSEKSIAQTVYVGEGEASIPMHQITINHVSKDNPRWPRNIQLSNEFIFLKRYGCPTVGMHVDDFISLCTKAEPKISWPPIFKSNSIVQGSPATITAFFETSNPELTEEENVISYQWQQSIDNVNWEDINDDACFSGTKTNTISVQNLPGDRTKVLRCVATNAAGSRAGLPVTSAPMPVKKP